MSSTEAQPYEQLLEMISTELMLAGEGRFEELHAANDAREAFIAGLPATPPEAAREPLQRAALMQERLTIELARGKEALLLALRGLQVGKRTARGYAPPPRGPRISASA
jgi:sugar diacid utilization regulator